MSLKRASELRSLARKRKRVRNHFRHLLTEHTTLMLMLSDCIAEQKQAA